MGEELFDINNIKFSPLGTAVLAVPAPRVSQSVHLQALADGFQQKQEHHITLVGADTVARLNLTPQQLPELMEGLTLGRCLFGKELFHLAKPKNFDGQVFFRRSLVSLVLLSEVDNFFEQLSKRLGQTIAIPFPHVTLYTQGDTDLPFQGIGIESANDFYQYLQGTYADQWQDSGTSS
jgi:hypothetical protein